VLPPFQGEIAFTGASSTGQARKSTPEPADLHRDEEQFGGFARSKPALNAWA